MRKKIFPLSNEDAAGIGLVSSGFLTMGALALNYFSNNELSPLQESLKVGVTLTSVCSFGTSLLSVIFNDAQREESEKTASKKNIAIILAGVTSVGVASAAISYPHFAQEEFVRSVVPAISSNTLVPVNAPRSKMGLQPIENSVCKPFAKEFAYKADHFRGDDGRGGVMSLRGNYLYRVNCVPYIRDHEHEFPKPD